MNPIDRSYERLAESGGVGLDRGSFSTSTHRWAGLQCQRGGCHRTARRMVRIWLVCNECGDAIEKERFP